MLPKPLDLRKPMLFCQQARVGSALREVGPQRNWPPEAHAGVAVAMPSPPHSQPQALAQPRTEHPRIETKLRSPVRARIRRAGQHAILQHAVIVEADWHEHDIARSSRVEPRHHVTE